MPAEGIGALFFKEDLFLLAWLIWNPDRVLFTVPFIDRPIMVYGALFVLGFVLGFLVMVRLLHKELLKMPLPNEGVIVHTAYTWAYKITDRLTWYTVIGTLVGARLGHVFFYDWPRYQGNWIEIFAIWKGGLASHGGVCGVFLAVLFYYTRNLRTQFPSITFLGLLDMMVIPSSLVACFIRLGNFFNQEIVGPETNLPWAVIFGDPSDGRAWVPRHPSQLYEALAYFVLFLFLYKIRTSSYSQRPGFMTGLFFVLLFAFRFLIEFVKLPQSLLIDESILQMGQILSIPFILAGFLLIYNSFRPNYLKN